MAPGRSNALLKSGTLTASASYERRGGDVRARIAARSDDLTFDRVSGGSLRADFDLERDRLSGTAQADLKLLGRLNFDFQDLHGIALESFDPARATGKVAIDGQVRLKDLTQLIPPNVDLPFDRALGTIKYDVAIERQSVGTGLPTFHVHVATNKLQLAGKRSTTTTISTKAEARDTAPLASQGHRHRPRLDPRRKRRDRACRKHQRRPGQAGGTQCGGQGHTAPGHRGE